MSTSLEITKDTILEFMDIQEVMLSAREENAIKTYGILKKKYIALKAILNAAGVNLTEIDKIKE